MTCDTSIGLLGHAKPDRQPSVETQTEEIVLSYREYGSFKDHNGSATDDRRATGPAWVRRLFPCGFRRELWGLFSLAWPAALAGLSIQFFSPISLMFSGQLGRAELDGVGLALSVINITGVSVGTGLATACDTLFSQTYGGKNKHLLGIYLQRSLLLISLSAPVCWSIHLNGEAVLLLLGQNREVAKIAGQYLLYFMPGLLFNFIFQVFVKYLQNQNRVLSAVVLGFFGNLVNLLAQYLAIDVLEAGIIGSSVGQVISYFIMMIATVLYVILTGLYRETWSGWTWEALEHWGQYLQLAVGGMVMTAIEWWCVEIGIFLNGILGEVELGSTTVAFQLEVILYMVSYGIGVASSIRVGHSLGRGDAKAAKTTAMTAQVFSWMGWIFVAIILSSLRNVLPLLFTNDKEIVAMTSEIISALIAMAFLDSIVATSMGTMRGCGRQWTGAICNTIGYVCIAMPLAVVFMFVIRIGAVGFWWSLCIGIAVSAILYLAILLLRVDWDKEVIKAATRTKRKSRRAVHSDTAALLPNEANTDGALENHAEGSFHSQPNGTTITYGKQFSVSGEYSVRRKVNLVMKRSAGVLAVIAILLVGLIVRLLVPLPGESPSVIDSPDNSTVTKELFQISTPV